MRAWVTGSDAIAARMAANAVVLHWATAVRNWALI